MKCDKIRPSTRKEDKPMTDEQLNQINANLTKTLEGLKLINEGSGQAIIGLQKTQEELNYAIKEDESNRTLIRTVEIKSQTRDRKTNDIIKKKEKEIEQLKKELKTLQERYTASTNVISTQNVMMGQMNKQYETDRQEGIKRAKLKRRAQYVEYIHSYLTNPALNNGKNIILMPQLIKDLQISSKTAVTTADEIANGTVECGYDIVVKWAKSKNRFKYKIEGIQ